MYFLGNFEIVIIQLKIYLLCDIYIIIVNYYILIIVILSLVFQLYKKK